MDAMRSMARGAANLAAQVIEAPEITQIRNELAQTGLAAKMISVALAIVALIVGGLSFLLGGVIGILGGVFAAAVAIAAYDCFTFGVNANYVRSQPRFFIGANIPMERVIRQTLLRLAQELTRNTVFLQLGYEMIVTQLPN